MRKRWFMLLTLLPLVLILLHGCQKTIRENDVAYISVVVDRIMQGIMESSYEKFSQDLNPTMKNAFDVTAFMNLKTMLDEKVGPYQSKKFCRAFKENKDNRFYTTVIYNAKFARETTAVVITITTEELNGEIKVAGLYFNSPNLRR